MSLIRNPHKLVLLTGCIAGFLLAALLLMGIFLPRWINSEMLKPRIVAIASETISGNVDYQNADLTLWPLPHLVIHDVRFSIPETAAGQASGISLYPAMLPLLKGNLHPRILAVDTPRIKFFLPKKQRPSATASGIFNSDIIENRLYSLTQHLASRFPHITIQLKNGELSLLRQEKPLFRFSDMQLNATINDDALQADFSCKSSLFENIHTQISGNLTQHSLQAAVQLNHFSLDKMMAYLVPEGLYGWTVDNETDLNLDMMFKLDTHDQQNLETHLKAADSQIVLSNGKIRQIVGIDRLNSFLQRYEKTLTVQCSELELDRPDITLRGLYQYIPDLQKPHMIEMEGLNADVAAIRESVLAFGSENIIIRLIFSILRAGDVPKISFNSQAEAFARLWHPNIFNLQGRMNNGKIHIPRADLNLENVQGNLNIVHCVLKARNLSATMGNTRGYDGILDLGLLKWDAPLHLDMGLDADLSQLPPILKRVVPIDAFQHELKMVDQVTGHAEGHLILGERLFRIRPQIKINHFDLSARYKRLPFPVTVKGGDFFLDQHRITGRHISGELGHSTFQELAWQLKLKKKYPLHFDMGRHRAVLEELVPWLCEYPAFEQKLNTVQSLRGHLNGSRLSVDGPFLEPDRWQLNAQTSVQNLSFMSTRIEKPVMVDSGQFNISPDRLKFSELKGRIMDASLILTGHLNDYRNNSCELDVTLSGMIRPKAYQLLADKIHLPAELYLKAPLHLQNVRLMLDKTQKKVLEGSLKPPVGEAFFIRWEQLSTGRKRVEVRLEDQKSNAAIEYAFSSRSRELSFKGYLHHSTLDRIMKRNRLLAGWLKGDGRVHLLMPHAISAHGNLNGQYIHIPDALPCAVTIEFFDLKAAAHHITLAPTAIQLEDMKGTLSGDIDFQQNQILMDISAEASHLKWDFLERFFNTEKRSPQTDQPDVIPGFQVRGSVHLKSREFKYDQYIWKPLHADISFEEQQTRIDVTRANLCGISTPGSIRILPERLSVAFHPSADKQDMNHAVSCLLNKKDLITGQFSLKGDLQATTTSAEQLKDSLRGAIDFNSSDGRIYRLNLLAKILALLNVTELIRGKIPDIIEEGFRYETLKSHAEINNGSLLTLSDGILDAPSMKLTFEGQIDLKHQHIDLTILVAPFQTINFIIKHIPVVGGLLEGSLNTIPLRAEGDLNNPKIKLLSSSEISERLIDLMKRTIDIPFKLIRPLMDNG